MGKQTPRGCGGGGLRKILCQHRVYGHVILAIAVNEIMSASKVAYSNPHSTKLVNIVLKERRNAGEGMSSADI